MTSPEAAKRKTLNIVSTQRTVPLQKAVRAIADFVDGMPVFGRLAMVEREIGKDGSTVQVQEWLPATSVPDKYKLTQPDQDAAGLMHFPEYRENVRRTKLAHAFLHIKQRILENIGLDSKDDANAIAVWILATHFAPIFDHFPLLDFFKAGYNAGGSVAFTTTMTYCARPWIVQDPTEAALFRYADAMKPTVGIEEFTSDMKQETRDTILTLLDGSFDKGRKVPRTDRRGKVVMFDLFGPKVIVDPQALISRYSTASRTLFIKLINKAMQSEPER